MPACRGERALRGERDPKERLKKKSEKAEKGNSSSFISSFLLLGALIGRGGWCGPQPVLCTRGKAHCGGLGLRHLKVYDDGATQYVEPCTELPSPFSSGFRRHNVM